MPTGGNDESFDWYKIIRKQPLQPITIQNADGTESTIDTDFDSQDKACAFVVITKEGRQVFGLLLLRDGSYIPKEGGIQHWGMRSEANEITYDQYLILKDAGCLFLSSTGYFSSTFSQWRYGNFNSSVEGHYYSSTSYRGNTGYKVYIMRSISPSSPLSSVSPASHSSDNSYCPVRLVKAISTFTFEVIVE